MNNRMKMATALILAAALVLAAAAVSFAAPSDPDWWVMDFEDGLAEGDIVDQVSEGNGLTPGASAPPALGDVGVYGNNDAVTGNAAMIFDADCPGGGGGTFDPDLCVANQGNVLIVSTDGTDPNDEGSGSNNPAFEFDFSTFDGGSVHLHKMTVIDIETGQNATVEMFDALGNPLLPVVNLPITGDGVKDTVDIDQTSVQRVVIKLNGSGAIDDLEFTPEISVGGATRPTDVLGALLPWAAVAALLMLGAAALGWKRTRALG